MSTVREPLMQRRVTMLAPGDFATEADEPGTVVVDLREADERSTFGSIAGAVHVPRGLLEFRADPTNAGHDVRLSPTARILLYCDDGTRSMLATSALDALGYTDIGVLRGGVHAWDAASLPLVGRSLAPY